MIVEVVLFWIVYYFLSESQCHYVTKTKNLDLWLRKKVMIIDAAINIHKKAIQDHYRSYKTLDDTRPQIEQVSLANMFFFLFLLHYLFALEQFFCKYFWGGFFVTEIFFFDLEHWFVPYLMPRRRRTTTRLLLGPSSMNSRSKRRIKKAL